LTPESSGAVAALPSCSPSADWLKGSAASGKSAEAVPYSAALLSAALLSGAVIGSAKTLLVPTGIASIIAMLAAIKTDSTFNDALLLPFCLEFPWLHLSALISASFLYTHNYLRLFLSCPSILLTPVPRPTSLFYFLSPTAFQSKPHRKLSFLRVVSCPKSCPENHDYPDLIYPAL
jgi:hypothetical protein